MTNEEKLCRMANMRGADEELKMETNVTVGITQNLLSEMLEVSLIFVQPATLLQ